MSNVVSSHHMVRRDPRGSGVAVVVYGLIFSILFVLVNMYFLSRLITTMVYKSHLIRAN